MHAVVSKATVPLVYACSGCSSAAQMANDLAIRLDRDGIAEMSCIAGVGGDVPSLVKVATSGRPIIAIDGCPLRCVRSCLARHGVTPTRHVVLREHGVKKHSGDYDASQLESVHERLAVELSSTFRGANPPARLTSGERGPT